MTQLATRLRPKTLDEIIGQPHLTGPDGIITKMVDSGQIGSMILYGEPGTGKTSIAHALSGTTGQNFGYFNASTDPKKKLQDFAKEVDKTGEPIIILLDEIHRLNKTNQDYLLPFVENGEFIIIGATTENPYIAIQPALRSRTQIFQVHPLKPEDIKTALVRAFEQDDVLKEYHFEIDDTAMELLITRTNGDVRHALNALGFAINAKNLNNYEKGDTIKLETEDVEQILQQRAIGGDSDGDTHYDLLSAFQKSIRGSDANGALHYLARLLEAGDIISVVRRLTVIAFEDIGLANPDVWSQTYAATQAAQSVGLPEATIPLSAITVQLALSPKSNASYAGYNAAVQDLRTGADITIPAHLRDAHYKGASELGHGVEYKYPHSYPFAVVDQTYLPDDLLHRKYIEFSESVNDQELKKRYDNLDKFNK